jgi:hypothetical protein
MGSYSPFIIGGKHTTACDPWAIPGGPGGSRGGFTCSGSREFINDPLFGSLSRGLRRSLHQPSPSMRPSKLMKARRVSMIDEEPPHRHSSQLPGSIPWEPPSGDTGPHEQGYHKLEPTPYCLPLVVGPWVAGTRLTQVLMNGGISLNLLYRCAFYPLGYHRSRVCPHQCMAI